MCFLAAFVSYTIDVAPGPQGLARMQETPQTRLYTDKFLGPLYRTLIFMYEELWRLFNSSVAEVSDKHSRHGSVSGLRDSSLGNVPV